MKCLNYFKDIPTNKVFNVLIRSLHSNDEYHNAIMIFKREVLVPGYGGKKGNETKGFVFLRDDGKEIILTNSATTSYGDTTSFFSLYGDDIDGMEYVFLK